MILRFTYTKVLTLIPTGLLIALCFSVEAQQSKKIPQIGYLTLLAKPDSNEEAFVMGLRDLGYIDGQNISIEYRRARGGVERLAELAVDLVRRPVDLIVARSTPAVQAAKNATTTIPVVMFAAALCAKLSSASLATASRLRQLRAAQHPLAPLMVAQKSAWPAMEK